MYVLTRILNRNSITQKPNTKNYKIDPTCQNAYDLLESFETIQKQNLNFVLYIVSIIHILQLLDCLYIL